jgi:hypothetical protein
MVSSVFAAARTMCRSSNWGSLWTSLDLPLSNSLIDFEFRVDHFFWVLLVWTMSVATCSGAGAGTNRLLTLHVLG